MGWTIRSASATDAPAVGSLANQFASYGSILHEAPGGCALNQGRSQLIKLGDPTFSVQPRKSIIPEWHDDAVDQCRKARERANHAPWNSNLVG